MGDIILDTVIDTIKLIPFLFITYLIMEYLEHKTGNKFRKITQNSGKYGPLIGGLLGILPQCGFSVAATNLYATNIINMGTLISVYLATSDEMIPIMFSEKIAISVILKILLIKLVIAVIAGFIVNLIVKDKSDETEEIEDLCKKDHCHCEQDGIFKSALKHTLNITIFILIITFVINVIIHFIGENNIADFIQSNPLLSPMLASLIGLIPNCAASVVLTQLYVQKIIPVSTLISGLLVGAGVGLAVLFRMNKDLKENLKIVCILFVIGTLSGVLLQFLGVSF